MSNYQELVTIFKELLFNRFYPKPQYIRGLLGDGRGNVLVPERPDYNYVRFSRASSETFEVFNKEVSQPVDGWPVLIGEFPWTPGLVQVVATDWSAYAQTGWGNESASIQAHAPTHEWPNFTPGSDAINTYLRAITPMRTQAAASGSTSVMVTAYEYDGATGTSYAWPGLPELALGAATPSTGTMRYMGVYLNPTTNTLGVVTGATTIFTDALEPPRPAWPRGVMPSAYVRLYGGQSQINERDIRDARRLWESTLIYTGALGPHNLLSQFHPDTLTASVVSGDLIYGNATPKWTRLPITTGSYLSSQAGTPAWSTVSYLTAPDGSPNPAFYMDNAGDATAIGDLTAGATARGVATAGWFDYTLTDSFNSSGIASHFKDNSATFPTGWTEADSAAITNTNRKYSFWFINGTSSNTAWKYRRQTSISIETQGSAAFVSFMFGPLFFRDGDFTGDVEYRLGMYRNNAGAIDEQTYCRVKFYWDSAASLWKIQGEEKDGTTGHTGTIVTLNQDPPLQPIFLRFVVQNAAGKNTRSYFGTSPIPESHTLIFSRSPSAAPTWGTAWLQLEMSRGAGVDDYLYLGAVDYNGNAA